MDSGESADGRFTDQGDMIYDFGDSFLVRYPRTSGVHRDDVLEGMGRLHALLEREE